MTQDSDIGLLLHGVGSLAAYEAGAIAGLYDTGYRAVIIAASGMGAINAAIAAGNLAKDIPGALSTFWKHMASWTSTDSRFAINLISHSVDFSLINSRRVHLIVMLYAAEDGSMRLFDNHKTTIGPLTILACAQPPPMATMIDGMAMWGTMDSENPAEVFIRAWKEFQLSGTFPVVEIVPDIKTTHPNLTLTPGALTERYNEIMLARSAAAASGAAARTPGVGNLCRIKIVHEAMSGICNFDKVEIDRRYRAGYGVAYRTDVYLNTFHPGQRFPQTLG
jgi:hypothetical protein